MVSYAVPNGQLPVKPRSAEHLNVTVKAESSALNQGSTGGLGLQWQSHNNGMSGQAAGLGRICSPLRQSSLPNQSSPKREFHQHLERERERDQEYPHDRKRSKIHDSVHTISSQMQSQLLSPRGPGPTGPTLTRDLSLPNGKYGEPQQPHSAGSLCRMVSAPQLPQSVNPLLDEPSPLGLTLRKTPSLLDLISLKLAQNTGYDQGYVNSDALAAEAAKNRASKCLVPTATAQDKLKASNFPASSLKIGNWERVSRYEGDLVGKCYYAKRKLVWEVLETGLKSKIEIQWSDICAMKASCPDNLPGTLQIEVSRPPLFFRETNPQPRKHTLWQATSDFTGGQATVNKRHSLIFPEGVLNRHYEKLVQCDPRLKALVEGTLVNPRPSPDFEYSSSKFEAQHQHLSTHQQSGHQSSPRESVKPQQSYSLPQHMQIRPNPVNTLGGLLSDSNPERRLMKMQSNDLASPSSVMDARVSDESGTSDNEDLRLQDELNDFDTMDRLEMIYPNDHLEDLKPLCNTNYLGAGSSLPPDRGYQPDRKILDQIAQDLLGETSFTMSNDQAMMLAHRVGYMSASLAEEFQMPHPSAHGLMGGSILPDGNQLHHFNPLYVKCEMGLGDDQLEVMLAPSANHHSHSFAGRLSQRDNATMPWMNKHGSASDLLLHLPRVASLPQLFESSSAQGPLSRYDPSLMRPSYLGSEKLR